MSSEGNNTRHIGSFVKEKKGNTPQPSGKNYLFVVAIDEYEHCPKLFNAVKDATDLIEVLTKQYSFEHESVLSLFNEQATEENILSAFRSLAGMITPDDNLIIYFSGHGEFDEVFKEGYWVPVDAKQGAIQDYVPNSKIKTVLSAIKSHHTFLISDSCFSGSLFMQYRSTGLAERLEKDPSRWGLTAGRNEIVADGSPGSNSPFSDSLIYHLKNNEGSIGVGDLCNKVMEDVIANANQTPRGEPLKVEGHRGGQFFFHPKGFVPSSPGGSTPKKTISKFQPEFIGPVTGKKRPLIPFLLGGLLVLALLIFGVKWFSKPDKPKKANITKTEQTQPESSQQVPPKLPENNTPKETQSPKPSKDLLLPYLEKGDKALNQNPPDFDAAKKYFQTAMTIAEENNLDKKVVNQRLEMWKKAKRAYLAEKEKERLAKAEASKPKTGSFKDARDGRTYKTVFLNNKEWMSEDLKYDIAGESWCFKDEAANCDKNGKVYSWKGALKACPSGWRLPSIEEWRRMVNKAGGHQYSIPKLVKGGQSGLDIIISGQRSYSGTWANLGQHVKYWSSSEKSGSRSYAIQFSNADGENAMIYYLTSDKGKDVHPCRCVKK